MYTYLFDHRGLTDAQVKAIADEGLAIEWWDEHGLWMIDSEADIMDILVILGVANLILDVMQS